MVAVLMFRKRRLHAPYSVALQNRERERAGSWPTGIIMSLENAYRHLPLGLQMPEQQSEFVLHGSFLAAHSPPPPSHASRPYRLTPLDAAVQAFE